MARQEYIRAKVVLQMLRNKLLPGMTIRFIDKRTVTDYLFMVDQHFNVWLGTDSDAAYLERVDKVVKNVRFQLI